MICQDMTKMRVIEFFYDRKWRLKFSCIFWIFGALLLIPTTGLAKTVFYGAGNDGYYNDVVGMETALSTLIGVRKFSSYTHTNLSGSEIYDTTVALKPFLDPNDTLIWYYSGHGHFFSDDSLGDETQPGSFALDSYDEAVGLQGNNDWLSDDELARALNSLADTTAGILTIVDMCYAGGLVGGTSDLNIVPDLTFLGSSSELELSYFFSSDSYSLFTDSLIQGLFSWTADSDSDGILWASEWFQYSYDLTVGSAGVQHPVYFGEDLMIASQKPVPVPIPGSAFLLGTGLLGFILQKRYETQK